MQKQKILVILISSVMLVGLFMVEVLTGKYAKHKEYEKQLSVLYQQFPNLTEEELSEIPKPGHPDLAAYQDFINTMDPGLQYVPDERLYKAYKKTKEIQTKANFTSLQWEEQTANIGGRVRAVMFDPNDTTGLKAWAGGVTGGLWYTDNIYYGYDWMPVDDFWQNLAVSCIVYDPNDPQTFYVGTGESETAVLRYRSSSGVGVGIWKTSDGGETWNLLESTEYFKYVTDIDVRIENGESVVYAGVVSGLYEGQHHYSEPNNGLYRSTDDGETWAQVLPEIEGTSTPYSPSDVIIIGETGRIIVGTTPNTEAEGGATLLYSDDGINWTVNDDYKTIIENDQSFYLPGRVMLTYAPSDENVVYALIASGIEGASLSFDLFYGNYVLRSDDQGVTWTQKTTPAAINWAYIAWHALTISVHPTNPDIIYVGGLDVHRSTNAGDSWEQISLWYNYNPENPNLPGYLHADHHTILFKADNSGEVLFSTDGGLFYSIDPTAEEPDFFERNRLFNTLQYYACAIHPEAGNDYFLAGAQDNGTFRYTGETINLDDHVSGGDGAYCFIDEDEPNIQFSTSQFSTFYISTDGNFNYLSDYLHSDFGIFINPCDYDSKLNTLYANGMDLYGGFQDILARVFNFGDGVYKNYVSLGTGSTVPYSHIKVSQYSPEGTTTLFIGTQSGRIFKVENAQDDPEVTELTSNDFPTASVSAIDVGNSEDHLIATFSNYGVESVWISTDGGNTWLDKEGNLPDMPVRWVLFQPQNDRMAIVATEIGVWACDDLYQEEANWYPTPDGFANVRVDMLRLRKSDNTVLAGTHGRGLYTAIYNDMSPDAGVLSINSPQADQDYTSSEEINVTIKNYGISNIDGIDVYYQLNDNEIITENIDIILSSDTTFEYVFSSTINLTEHIIHSLKVWTGKEGDTHNNNDTILVTFDNSSLSKEFGLSNFELYPNPAKDQVNLSFTTLKSIDLEIKLIDASGKIIYNDDLTNLIGYNNYEINFESNPGLHFLVLNNGEQSITRRVMVY